MGSVVLQSSTFVGFIRANVEEGRTNVRAAVLDTVQAVISWDTSLLSGETPAETERENAEATIVKKRILLPS